jgi:hypothetical protein
VFGRPSGIVPVASSVPNSPRYPRPTTPKGPFQVAEGAIHLGHTALRSLPLAALEYSIPITSIRVTAAYYNSLYRQCGGGPAFATPTNLPLRRHTADTALICDRQEWSSGPTRGDFAARIVPFRLIGVLASFGTYSPMCKGLTMRSIGKAL